MELAAAEQLARALMAQHGLTARGWRFAWGRGQRQLGSVSIRRHRLRPPGPTREDRVIRLSRHLVRLNDPAQVRDTILHEIAHALAGLEHGHGPAWQAVCVRIGARPRRLADESVRIMPGRYRIVCGRCRRSLGMRFRRLGPRRLARSYCRHCGPASMGQLQQLETGDGRPDPA